MVLAFILPSLIFVKQLFIFIRVLYPPSRFVEFVFKSRGWIQDPNEYKQLFIFIRVLYPPSRFEDKFYKSRGWIQDPNEYKQLFNEYEAWQDKCQHHVKEATKAANWLADVVRRDINPLFFATKGRFFVIMGPYEMLQFRSCFFEYTEQEKLRILQMCQEGWGLGEEPSHP